MATEDCRSNRRREDGDRIPLRYPCYNAFLEVQNGERGLVLGFSSSNFGGIAYHLSSDGLRRGLDV